MLYTGAVMRVYFITLWGGVGISLVIMDHLVIHFAVRVENFMESLHWSFSFSSYRHLDEYFYCVIFFLRNRHMLVFYSFPFPVETNDCH